MLRDLTSIAEAARAFLLPHWYEWHDGWGPPAPSMPSQWTCVRSSLFLTRVLRQCGFDATFQSGRPFGQAPHNVASGFGIFTTGGWVSHAWVEVRGSIIDITADQFGHVSVYLNSTDDPAYRSTDRANCQLAPTSSCVAAVDKVWAVWCESSDCGRPLTASNSLKSDDRRGSRADIQGRSDARR